MFSCFGFVLYVSFERNETQRLLRKWNLPVKGRMLRSLWDGLQSWRRSCASLFLNHIWLHTLVAFVWWERAHTNWAGGRVCSGLNRPAVWRIEQSRGIKGRVITYTYLSKVCQWTAHAHTYITVSSWVSFIIQPCDLFMCLFLSLKMGLFLPLWSVFQISHQESLGTTSLSPMGPY